LSADVILAFDRSIALFQWSAALNELVEVKRFHTASQPLLMTYIGPKKPSSGILGDAQRPLLLILTSDNYNVTCLSFPGLEPVWSSRVPGMARHVREFDSLALADHAMVADYTGLYKGDVGAVFLTLRFDSQYDVSQTLGSSDYEANNLQVAQETVQAGSATRGQEVNSETDTRAGTARLEVDRSEQRAFEYVTHVSFFAFDLTTGKLRWRNTARDDHSRLSLHDVDVDAYMDADQEEMSQSAHDYRRHVAERAQHFEEGNWRIWKEDLIELALPHQWYTTRHTSLTPVRFSVNQEEAKDRRGRRKIASLSSTDFEDPYHYMSHHYQRSSKRSPNNVLLYENSDGITVVHLYTGKVLTRLPLPAFRTYADANGDLTINSVVIDEEHGLLHMSTLYEEERTLSQSQVYTSKLPSFTPSLARLHTDSASSPIHTEFVPPLLLPATTQFSAPGASYSGIVGKVLNQILPDVNHQLIPDKAYYMVLLNSQGYMYCVRSDTGEVQWMIETDTGWAGLQAVRSAIYGGFQDQLHVVKQTAQQKQKQQEEQHAKKKFVKGRRGQIELAEEQTKLDKKLSALLLPYSIESKDTHPTGILAVSPIGLVLVSPDGNILAREVTQLPAVSKTTLPVIADFTNDGRNDLIVATHRGYHFYVLNTGKSHIYPLLVACFLLVLIIIVFFKVIEARRSQKEAQRASASVSRIVDATASAKVE